MALHLMERRNDAATPPTRRGVIRKIRRNRRHFRPEGCRLLAREGLSVMVCLARSAVAAHRERTFLRTGLHRQLAARRFEPRCPVTEPGKQEVSTECALRAILTCRP
jgi:hypothetical protein